ncbi:MAG TPA: hypothetical protein PL009_00940 [Flavipsychrobacter sp.]|nr:hypothetical protein [Flavipsychrobacter sp.]
MKSLLVIIMFLPYAVFSKGNYTYKSIVQVANGTDNFKLPQYAIIEQQGSIVLSQSSLIIDDKFFKLKPTDDRKIYKTKGGVVKFIYENRELRYIQLYQYNNLFHFDVATVEDVAKK